MACLSSSTHPIGSFVQEHAHQAAAKLQATTQPCIILCDTAFEPCHVELFEQCPPQGANRIQDGRSDTVSVLAAVLVQVDARHSIRLIRLIRY